MLVLLRHGEAVGNADGLLLGRIDSPLTERGKRQAAGLATLFDSGTFAPSVSRRHDEPARGGERHRRSARPRRPDRGG